MADEVNISELDASDLSDILSEINGKATKVKNVAAARKELAAALESKSLVLTTDDEGNFVLNPKKTKTKAKAKAAPEPEPEEDEEEEAEESEEDEESEDEEESEEEAEEEEEEEEAPPPKKKGKAAPAPAPAKKGKAKAEPEEDDEEEEVEAPPAKKGKAKAEPKAEGKRAPPPREPKIKDDEKITIVKADAKFQEGSGRAAKWALIKKCKTVGEFIKKATDAELATPRGYVGHCVKSGYIKLG